MLIFLILSYWNEECVSENVKMFKNITKHRMDQAQQRRTGGLWHYSCIMWLRAKEVGQQTPDPENDPKADGGKSDITHKGKGGEIE